MSNAVVYAVWVVKELPEFLHDIHISCGEEYEDEDTGEEILNQFDGYFIENKGASLFIEPVKEGYRIALTAPSDGLEESNWWLSPNQIDGQDARDYGMREVAA